MSLYIYAQGLSRSALELSNVLGARRLRKFDGLHFWNKRERVSLDEGDMVICWGSPLPEIDGVRILNSNELLRDKYMEQQTMYNQGVRTIGLKRTQDLQDKNYKKHYSSGYVPRSLSHKGGRDLLFGCPDPDILSYKNSFVEEYRIHSFNGKSIRAGVKVPRAGFKPTEAFMPWKPGDLHPWVKTFEGGWDVRYDDFKSTIPQRKLAHHAIRALGFTFGAVDIGWNDEGLRVIDVNTAPDLDPGSLTSYIRAINKWITGVPDEIGTV